MSLSMMPSAMPAFSTVSVFIWEASTNIVTTTLQTAKRFLQKPVQRLMPMVAAFSS